MQNKEILGKLAAIFSEVLSKEVTMEELDAQADLLEAFHMDSLIALQIIVKIEQQLGIVIEDDDLALELLNDTGKLMAYIEGQSERVSS
ncbi:MULTISPECIES: acyl carrier protein [Paenibacillus]|uniref:acyl carrier protein n=1 Tax=Paenibacillus TaxID=44249 RepID=UPI00096D6B6C|nr:acyl carrier protein [Paenibacillus odorifer]OMD13649.1 hypothetical protein BJP50_23385 [Paenibacillus odorifer]OZQ67607.1 hypothetical protein CA596_26410 [Paenibacillus odorifer]